MAKKLGGMAHEALTEQIIGAAIDVHRELGPGLLESAYEQCFCVELELRGLQFARQVAVPLEYKGVSLECGYRIDCLVENSVIIELKAVQKLEPVHEAQLLTYMRLLNIQVGLLMNFNTPVLKNSIKRRIL